MSTKANFAANALANGNAPDDYADRNAFETVKTSEPVTLDLSDMIKDANGEVVLFNDSHLHAMAVRSDVEPIETGDAGPYVTASGIDVEGFHFIAFENGLKLFYQDGLELVVVSAGAN